jgi:SAM-dependent methyltransferase
MYKVISRLKRAVPEPVISAFKAVGLQRWSSYFLGKRRMELAFQAEWAQEFRDNRELVLDYWTEYRYLREIEDVCRIGGESRLLDVGCGISSVLHFVEGRRFGIDPLADEYKKLYDYPEGIEVREAPGEDIPFPEEWFDVVFCTNVLDHVTSPLQTIREMNRVLREGGYLVLTCEIFDTERKRDPAHPHSLTREKVKRLVEADFTTLFERESPWIGLRSYVNGSREAHNNELIMVLAKKNLRPRGRAWL